LAGKPVLLDVPADFVDEWYSGGAGKITYVKYAEFRKINPNLSRLRKLVSQ